MSVVPSPAVSEKALRLLEQQRVYMSLGTPEMAMIVRGDTGLRIITARVQGVACDCAAGANLDPVSCSHKVAAQVAWAES